MQSEPEQMELDAQNGASDGSTSDSDDSDYEEVEVSMEDMANITKLETELESNPNTYDVHLQYIALLRKCKMRERARAAREAMHARFPFSESLWLEWLQDELQESEADQSRMQHLFELATQDYLSTRVWVMYISWAAAMAAAQDSKENCERVRDIGERAVTAGGLHVAEGSTIWDAYRVFEVQHLAQHPDDEQQVQRVRSLYCRQLQVPLNGNENILKAHEDWEAQQSRPQTLPPHVHAQYKKAQAAVQQRQAHEEAVASGKEANEELLAAYMTYIQLEQEQGQPSRVMVVYERAVAMFPVTHLLWQQYAAYLQGNLKVHSVIKKVYERAVQNCPWVGLLWQGDLRALERAGCSGEEHRSQYEKALQAGLQTAEDYTEVLLARIDYLRRKGKEAYPETREAFKASQELLASYFHGWVDRSLAFVMYEAKCALRLGGGISEARSVWNAALRTPLNKFTDVWTAFISMEVAEQNLDAARGIYKRCYSHVLEDGGQAAVCQAWVRFEREHGSAEDLLQALLKTTPIVERAAAEAMAAANAEAAAVAQAAAKKAVKLSSEEVRRMRQAKDPHFKKGGARGAGNASAAEADAAAMPPPVSRLPPKRKKGLGFQDTGTKRQRHEDGATADTAAAVQGTAEAASANGEAAAPAFASAGAQDVNAINDTGDTMPPLQGGPAPEAEPRPDSAEASSSGRPFYTDECTAFVRGLPQNVADGELDELFDDCGGLKEIRITRDSQTGQAKGFAYVEFDSREALDRAVAKGKMPFKGRELFIAVSRPKGGGARGGLRGRGRSFGDSQRGGRFQGRGSFRGGRRGGGRGRGRDSGDSNWQMGGNRGAPVGEGKGPGHHSVHVDLSGPPKGSTAASADAGGSSQGKKSNADFRNMFLSGGKL